MYRFGRLRYIAVHSYSRNGFVVCTDDVSTEEFSVDPPNGFTRTNTLQTFTRPTPPPLPTDVWIISRVWDNIRVDTHTEYPHLFSIYSYRNTMICTIRVSDNQCRNIQTRRVGLSFTLIAL